MPDYDQTVIIEIMSDDTSHKGGWDLAKKKNVNTRSNLILPHTWGCPDDLPGVKKKFQAMTMNSRLYIVAHSDGKTVKGKTGQFLAQFMVQHIGFQKAKVIYLVSCNSGVGGLAGEFARHLKALSTQNYHEVKFGEIRAPLGFVQVDSEGKKSVARDKDHLEKLEKGENKVSINWADC